jgi:cell division protein FtsL
MKTSASNPVDSKDYLSIFKWSGINRPSSIVLVCTLGLVLSTGLSVVQTTHENRFSFNKLQELRAQANQLDVKWGQLLLEQSTFGVEGRIESKAIGQLQMRVPEMARIVMVKND